MSGELIARDRVLILGAGRGQLGLIHAAKKMGLHAVVATLPSETAPGIAHADTVALADIVDAEAVSRAAREHGVSAVVTACADTALPALGYTCDLLGLPGLSSAAASLCADKVRMKEAFRAGSVRTANHTVVKSLADAQRALAGLGVPVVLKAPDLQGSQGIVVVRTQEQLAEAVDAVQHATKREELIMEEFIEGTEFGAQALVQNGRIQFVLLHNDETYVVHTPVPVQHSVPFVGTEGVAARAIWEIERAIKAVGLDNCAVNVDLIQRGDEVFVIEVTGRVGANGLPELVSAHFGLDYYEVLLELGLGRQITRTWEPAAEGGTVVKMVYAPTLAGTIRDIQIDREAVPEAHYWMFRRPGDRISGFTHSGDCVGQVWVSAPTLEEATLEAYRAERAIRIVVGETP